MYYIIYSRLIAGIASIDLEKLTEQQAMTHSVENNVGSLITLIPFRNDKMKKKKQNKLCSGLISVSVSSRTFPHSL